MADWELIKINVSNNNWTKASAEMVAELVGGEVVMATDLGITHVIVESGYTHVDVNTASHDVPFLICPDWKWGLVGWYWNNYYNPGAFTLQTLNEGQSTHIAMFGGDYTCEGDWLYMNGDGFHAFKQRRTNDSYNSKMIFDNIKDLVNGGSTYGIMSSTQLFDVVNEKKVGAVPKEVQVVAQNDGSCFVEIVPNMMYGVNDVLCAEHVMRGFYDYDATSRGGKVVLINGVKYERIEYTNLYIPLE